MHFAAGNGHVGAIKALVQLGADKEAKGPGGATPLHQVAGKGFVEAIKVLVQLGVNKEAKTANGDTALHLAACNGHVEAIKMLVQLGAQMDAQTDGQTPLQLSIRFGHHQAAEVLRELERTARAQKAAATSERAQQAAEHANRMAAHLIEEEEREQAECRLKAQLAAAQKEVRGVELAPLRWVSDAVS
jgi:hypothetical protein